MSLWVNLYLTGDIIDPKKESLLQNVQTTQPDLYIKIVQH